MTGQFLKKLLCTAMLSLTCMAASAISAYAEVPASVEIAEEELIMQACMEEQNRTREEEEFRQSIADYALSFLGGRYVDAGNDPHTGVDCSGFVKYVLEHAAGITLNRCSRDQAKQGETVTADEMRPGDLLFYEKNGRINHVAMYIGEGQVVHASTYKTGIKTSQWNYRTPVVIKNMLGD